MTAFLYFKVQRPATEIIRPHSSIVIHSLLKDAVEIITNTVFAIAQGVKTYATVHLLHHHLLAKRYSNFIFVYCFACSNNTCHAHLRLSGMAIIQVVHVYSQNGIRLQVSKSLRFPLHNIHTMDKSKNVNIINNKHTKYKKSSTQSLSSSALFCNQVRNGSIFPTGKLDIIGAHLIPIEMSLMYTYL
jgi:hypothetical protein